MSALKYLFFASLVYYTFADPVPVDQSSLAEASNDEFQVQIEALVTDIRKAVNEHLDFITKNLPPGEKADIENSAFDGIMGYLNYVIYLSNTEYDAKTANMLDNSIFIQFLFPPGTYIPGSDDTAEGAGNK